MKFRKCNMKGITACVLSAALLFSGMPVTGFAATVDGTYRAGIYTGEAAGFKNGNVTVTVELTKNADGDVNITDISANGETQTDSYWSKAQTLLSKIKENNGTDGLDTVSGATYSSKAILNATDVALLKASGENVFDGGVGTKASPYEISSKETMVQLKNAVASGFTYEGKYITLTQAIDLTGIEWEPIGSKTAPFAGSFNGKGYEISNLTIGNETTPSQEAYAGLFGYVTDAAEFLNVTLSDVCIYTKPTEIAYAGGVAAYAKVNSKVTSATVLQNCHVSGKIKVDTSAVNKTVMAGGIIGFGNQFMTIANCGSEVDMTVKTGTGIADVGGIEGFASVKSAIVNSYYVGNINVASTHTNTVVGGILGGATGMLYNNYSSAVITTDASNVSTKTGAVIGNEQAATEAEYCYYDTTKTSLNPAGATASSVTSYTAKTTKELFSDKMKAEMATHLGKTQLGSFADKIDNASGFTGYDFKERLNDIENQFYDWTVSGGKLTHSSELWTNTEIDISIFDGGDGTAENPYQIATEEQFRNFAVSLTEKLDYNGKYIKLTKDIDVGSKEWIQIGEGEYAFNGSFDGDGHTISNLKIGTRENPYWDDGSKMYFGLFGVLESNAEVKNLNLSQVAVYVKTTKSVYAGGLAGYTLGCTIDNVTVSGEVSIVTSHNSANIFAGGVSGAIARTKIINSHSDADVRAESVGGVAEAGGFCGMNNRGLIANCYATGMITGTADRVAEGAPSLGGIAGVHAGTIVNCYSVTDIVSDCYTGYVGSIAGWATGIADTFQSYYAADSTQVTDDKTTDRLEISPAVAIGWNVGPGINDEGEKYTGSVALEVTAFTKAEFAAESTAALLNANLGKLKVNLTSGSRQSGHWTGSETLNKSLCSWKLSEGAVKLDTEAARVTAVYDTNTEAEIQALLPEDEEEFSIEPASGVAINSLFASGDGSKENPWTIETEEQLIAFASHVNSEEDYSDKYIRLMKDITLTKEWIPAGGTAPYAFAGVFDGNGHTISNMVIGSTETPYKGKYAGMFAFIKGGSVSNLAIKDAQIIQKNTGNSRIYGGILSAAVEQEANGKETYVNRVATSGKIQIHSNSGAAYAGGISGQINRGNITNCQTNISIDAVSDAQWVYAGGISGMVARAGIVNNFADGDILATAPLSKAAIGGLCGFQSGVCYNDVSSVKLVSKNTTGDIGGLAGRNTGIGLMLKSYYSETAEQIAGDVAVDEKKAVGTIVSGENDGKGEVSGLEAVADLVADAFVVTLNNNRNDAASLNRVKELLQKQWENGLPAEAMLLTWENAEKNLALKGLLETAKPSDTGNNSGTENGEGTQAGENTESGNDAGTGENSQTDMSSELPKKGSLIKDNTGATYKVTKSDAKAGTVSYMQPKKSAKGSIKVPATVTINKVTYKVTAIGANAFKGNNRITKVTIGKNVAEIGKNAFNGCSKLKTVSMGSNVAAIGERAFYKCTALTKITIASKTNKIGKSAFEGCKKLKTITIKTTKLTKKNVGNKAFKGIATDAKITVPAKKLKAYKTLLKAKGVSAKAKIGK